MATHSSILAWRIWWTEEPRVTESQTGLSDFHFTFFFLRMESLFLPTLWYSCNPAPLAVNAKCSLLLLPRLLLSIPDLQAGSLKWGLELLLLWENTCHIIILQSEGHPPRWYGIWLYLECTPSAVSLWFLYVFGCRISFLGSFQSFLSRWFSSCDSDVPMKGGKLEVLLLCHLPSPKLSSLSREE